MTAVAGQLLIQHEEAELPPITIEFMPETIDEVAAEKLKKTLRSDAAERFSVPRSMLFPENMNVIFVELHPWSEPTHDIVVRIQLHDDKERLDKIDTDAEQMADLIAAALQELYVEQEVSIGVAILYAPIGWGETTINRNYFGEGSR